jgi:hypothetical protein
MIQCRKYQITQDVAPLFAKLFKKIHFYGKDIKHIATSFVGIAVATPVEDFPSPFRPPLDGILLERAKKTFKSRNITIRFVSYVSALNVTLQSSDAMRAACNVSSWFQKPIGSPDVAPMTPTDPSPRQSRHNQRLFSIFERHRSATCLRFWQADGSVQSTQSRRPLQQWLVPQTNNNDRKIHRNYKIKNSNPAGLQEDSYITIHLELR